MVSTWWVLIVEYHGILQHDFKRDGTSYSRVLTLVDKRGAEKHDIHNHIKHTVLREM